MLTKAVASVAEQTRPAEAHLISVDHRGEGQVAIRNRLLPAIETEWMAYLDDDDLFMGGHLELLMACAEQTGADLVYPWFIVEGGSDPLGAFGKEFDPVSLRDNNYIPVTHLCRTELAQEVGGFPRCPEEWPNEGTADWGFLLRLVDVGAKIVHLPEVTWIWTHWKGNTSGKPWRRAA